MKLENIGFLEGIKQLSFLQEIHKKYCLDGLESCKKILDERGISYGPNTFVEAAQIASFLSNKNIDARDVAYILMGIKMSRLKNLNRKNIESTSSIKQDTNIDLVNYILLAEREEARMKMEQADMEMEQADDEDKTDESEIFVKGRIPKKRGEITPVKSPGFGD